MVTSNHLSFQRMSEFIIFLQLLKLKRKAVLTKEQTSRKVTMFRKKSWLFILIKFIIMTLLLLDIKHRGSGKSKKILKGPCG